MTLVGMVSIDKDFDTCGLKRSFSVMHDNEARKENALDAEWDKKRDVEGKTREGKGTRWDKKDTDTKACEDLQWMPSDKKIKAAPEVERFTRTQHS